MDSQFKDKFCEFPDSVLLAEIKRRQDMREKSPKSRAKFSTNDILSACKHYTETVLLGGDEQDARTNVFETVMTSVYGNGFWGWWQECQQFQEEEKCRKQS
jgi:hypothetical protein